MSENPLLLRNDFHITNTHILDPFIERTKKIYENPATTSLSKKVSGEEEKEEKIEDRGGRNDFESLTDNTKIII